MTPFMVRLRRRLNRELDSFTARGSLLGRAIVPLQPDYEPPRLEARPKANGNGHAKPSRGKGLWPAPVYCAELETGEIARMSFYSQRGKPLDFDSGRRTVAMACRKHSLDQPEHTGHFYMALPARMKRGWVEIDGKNYLDPFFETYEPGQEMLRAGK